MSKGDTDAENKMTYRKMVKGTNVKIQLLNSNRMSLQDLFKTYERDEHATITRI